MGFWANRSTIDNIHITLLFSLTLEASVRHLDMRGNISTKSKQLCAYADDIVIVSRTKKNPWKKHILY
jgi:hypothetical protein